MGVAELEQIKRVAEADGARDVGEALADRLERIKAEHRHEIEALVAQRDALVREVDDLKQTRDVFADEAGALNARNVELNSLNLAASRQLDATREAQSRLAYPQQPFGLSLRGHQKVSPGPGVPSTVASPSSVASHQPSHSLASSVGSPSTSFDSAPDPAFANVQISRVDPQPSAARKFKWGKGKAMETLAATATAPRGGPYANPPGRAHASSTDLGPGVRPHALQQVSILRPVRCEHCGDKMWGLQELRCGACGVYCHARCAPAFQGVCHHATNGASSSGDPDSLDMAGLVFGRDLAEMRPCPPPIVTACIAAVEAHAMDYEGIYRKSGGTGQVRLISAVFDRGETPDLADLERFNDVSATTSALKSASRRCGSN